MVRSRNGAATSGSSLTAVDANAEFEAAIARLKELAGSENEQVAVKAASDLAKLLRPHLQPAAPPERTPEQQEADFLKTVPDYLYLIERLVREGKIESGKLRSQLTPILTALSETRAPEPGNQ
jgi:hypothetical protein